MGYPASNQYNTDKVIKDFDVKKELANRTFIKPLPSKGKLVKNSIFDIPSEIKKDFIYDTKAIGHAINGKANDHELGRLNDFGMKLGGLAIAGYLFTKKQTPMTKLFEFIGLGTFFAAMDIWPKMFIQLPAYLVHGVNIRQKYEDSFGRKKMFYQDPQFIPWDLYSDKEINKIGDRLNIPKDIPNRRDFIQEKMKKIALQNNTLWMLTAGFATPVMSALMCNLLEQPVSKYLSKINNQKADKLMSNFSQEIKKYNFDTEEKELAKVLESNMGKPITPELLKTIHGKITKDANYMISYGIAKDLEILIPTQEAYTVTDDSVKNLIKVIKDNFAIPEISEEIQTRITPTEQEIKNALNPKNLIDRDFKEFSQHSMAVKSLIDSKISALADENIDEITIKRLKFQAEQLNHSNEYAQSAKIFNSFKVRPAIVLDKEISDKLLLLSKTLKKFNAEYTVLENYSYMKAAQAPETSLADVWNTTSKEIFKALKFSKQEIADGRLDRELAGEILRNKIETIASDKKSYNEFIEAMQKTLATLHNNMSTIDMTQDSSINQYKAHVNESFEAAAKVFKDLGMDYTGSTLQGHGENNATSLKNLMFEFVENRKLGVKSSFYRLLNLADLYHRIATTEGIQDVLNERMPREIKEECAELAKTILLEGHSSDYANKLWQKRNPNANKSDYSQIESIDGKVINKYLGKIPTKNTAELSNDREFFKAVMRLMFSGELHPDTYNRLKDSGFLDDFKRYRQKSFEILGGDENFAKPHHLVGYAPTKSTSLFKFLLTGCASDELAYKHFNQTFNSKKWFSMFGKLGAVLAGVTIASQFFFGKMKNPAPSKKEVK